MDRTCSGHGGHDVLDSDPPGDSDPVRLHSVLPASMQPRLWHSPWDYILCLVLDRRGPVHSPCPGELVGDLAGYWNGALD